MSAFLRGKQAGITRDLSEGILPGLFALDDQARFGINSQISVLAYDPVQSLLAIGTNETPFGSGQIYIFGQNRVQVTLTLPRRASIRILQFCADRLVSVDSKNEVIVWDLAGAKKIASYAPPGIVSALVTDPGLDWALIGLQSGIVICYDLDRERLAPLKLPNFWQEKAPRTRSLPIMSLQLHPKDIGKLLICYSEGAVVYSFKQNAPTKYFHYEVPPGAPGGNSDPAAQNELRTPKLTQALWHPSGSFVLTAHDDESLVFWDPNEGRVLMARTLKDTNVNQPGPPSRMMDLKAPYTKIAWLCKENPDDSGILVAGGLSSALQEFGISFLDFGLAPVYATSSWQALSSYWEGKRQHIMPCPPGADIVDFCLIPRSSPHFAGAQDPIAVICLLSTGELINLSVPSGHPISPTNQLHPSLTFVHPFITAFTVATVDRGRWLGMTETRNQGPPILRGGAEGIKPLRRYEARNIMIQAAGDGTVRLWDAGHEDEIENSKSLQVDIARALGRYHNIDVSHMSMGSNTGELAIGTKVGEVIIYRWGGNKSHGREATPIPDIKPGAITNISGRSEPTLKEGLSPFVLYNMAQGTISAIKVSDVGFIGVGSESGVFSLIDLRGPAVIFSTTMSEVFKSEKRGSVFGKKSHGAPTDKADYPVQVEFGIMTVEGDNYSSILCFVGTSSGHLGTFKILPQPNGGYTAQFAGSVTCNGRVVSISPIKDSGKPASATGQAVAGLREGQQTHGTLVVVTDTEARIFRPASAKGAHKTWDDLICDSSSVTHFENHGYALVGVFGNTTRAFSIPGLKELGVADLFALDKTRIGSSIVTPSGDIFAFTGPSEIAMLNVWGTGQTLAKSTDKLYNPEAVVPPRPTISSLQWIAGTQYISPLDLDILIGGPDRPPSKRMQAATAEEQRQARNSGGAGAGYPRGAASQEGWGEYMTRQLNERTEKLNIMGDLMERVQENSASWADEAGKWAGKQKRNIVLKGLTSKFF